MQASLQLDRFALEELVIEVESDLKESSQTTASYNTNIDVDVQKHNEKMVFRVYLRVEIKPERIPGPGEIRRVVIGCVGYFSFAQEPTDEYIRQVTPLNQLAMLYGMARGIVASATGSTSGGTFVLPSVNFVEVLKSKATEQE